MAKLTKIKIGILKCAARPGGTGIPREGKAGGYLSDPFFVLMLSGYLEQTHDQTHYVLTPEGRDALEAEERQSVE